MIPLDIVLGTICGYLGGGRQGGFGPEYLRRFDDIFNLYYFLYERDLNIRRIFGEELWHNLDPNRNYTWDILQRLLVLLIHELDPSYVCHDDNEDVTVNQAIDESGINQR